MAQRRLTAVRLAIGILVFGSLAANMAAQKQPDRGGSTAPAPCVNCSEPEMLREPDDIDAQRQTWFLKERAYPFDSVPAGARLSAIRQMRQMTAERDAAQPTTAGAVAAAGQWFNIGPQPTGWSSAVVAAGGYSGRATAIAIDPRNNSVIYLGTAGGGVWKTLDGGGKWMPLTDSQPSLAIGSLALAPSSPDTVYAGTGEANFSGDSYYGVGILKSTDGGITWTLIHNVISGSTGTVGALAVDPANANVVLAGTNGGMKRSQDGGSTWTSVLTGFPTTIIFDPKHAGVVFASLGSPFADATAGIYQSLDDGVTWKQLLGQTSPIFGGTLIDRTSLAMDPTNSSILYAAIQDPYSPPKVGGILRSTDAGVTWTRLTSPGTNCCDWYRDFIAVDPGSPSLLVTGSFDSMVTFDGGTTWKDAGNGWSSVVAATGLGPHPDTHAAAFSSDGANMYLATDGGIYRLSNPTDPSAFHWTSLNATISTITFYPGLSLDPYNVNAGIGGTQDNGTSQYSGALGWVMIGCGDGGWSAIDPFTKIGYFGCLGTDINKIVNGASSKANAGLANEPAGWVAPLIMHPNFPSRLYFGGQHVFMSTDGAATWNQVSPAISPSDTIRAITPAPSAPATIYAAAGSQLQRTTNADAGASAIWTTINSGLPVRAITQIAVSDTNPNVAYVTLSGFGTPHVYKTSSGGSSWANISGNLPDTPANDVVIDPELPGTLYLGTDIGVFTSSDDGATWGPLGTGFPNVVVQALKLHRAARVLRAATHGRGMWQVAVPGTDSATINAAPAALSFDATAVGATSAATPITLTAYVGDVQNLSLQASGDFQQTNNCAATLPLIQTCTVNVSFAPSAVGSRTGSLSIASSAPGSPQVIPLTGTGATTSAPPLISVSPAALDFGSVSIDTYDESPATVTITAVRGPITNLSVHSTWFVFNYCPASLPIGTSCTLGAYIYPMTLGAQSGNITISYDGATAPAVIPVTGTGVAAGVPYVSVVPSPVDFGTVPLGTATAPQVITLNATHNSISNLAIAVPPEFPYTTNCGTTLMYRGNPCTITIRSQPGSAGVRNATLTITSSGADSPHAVPLKATGVSAAPTFHTGYWWNPAQNGIGFCIEHRGSNLLIIGFLYDTSGRPTWILSMGPMMSNTSYSGTFETYGFGQTLTGAFQPNADTGPAGPLSLSFTDDSNAVLTWPGGTVPLQRFSFSTVGPDATPTTTLPETGGWFNANEPGRGFTIEFQGTSMFIIGYMYDGDGNPVWYLSQGPMDSPTSYHGAWQKYTGGTTIRGPVRPDQFAGNMGSLAVTFSDTQHGTMTMPDGHTIPITRFQF